PRRSVSRAYGCRACASARRRARAGDPARRPPRASSVAAGRPAAAARRDQDPPPRTGLFRYLAPRVGRAGSSPQFHRHLLTAAPDHDPPQPVLLAAKLVELAGSGHLLVVHRQHDITRLEETLADRAVGDVDHDDT